MENHYHDADGVYTCSAPANPGSNPPANALRVTPPRREGYCAVRVAEAWELVPDHRGRVGWLNGERSVIAKPGPLPEGWSETPPEPVDRRESDEKVRDDFAVETDPLLLPILAYRTEAEALKLAGHAEKAKELEAKRLPLLREYLERKTAIRNRHRPESAPDAPTGEAAADAVAANAGDGRLYLTAAGSYHLEGCRYTAAPGEWLSPAAVVASGRKCKPCSLCRPGKLEE